jgi:hypothetical protein
MLSFVVGHKRQQSLDSNGPLHGWSTFTESNYQTGSSPCKFVSESHGITTGIIGRTQAMVFTGLCYQVVSTEGTLCMLMKCERDQSGHIQGDATIITYVLNERFNQRQFFIDGIATLLADVRRLDRDEKCPTWDDFSNCFVVTNEDMHRSTTPSLFLLIRKPLLPPNPLQEPLCFPLRYPERR